MNTISRSLLWGGVLVLSGVGCAGSDSDQHTVLDDAVDVAAQAAQQTVSPPKGVRFTSVAATGAGCPENLPDQFDSYYPDVTEDGGAFTIEFYKFKAAITPTDRIPETSLSCTMRIGLEVPKGYSYTVTDIVYQGESDLPVGTSASLLTTYGYQGSGLSPKGVTHAIKTPSSLQKFFFHDILDSQAQGIPWSTCGEKQLLNVNMVLHINNPQKKEGWAKMNYADAKVRTSREDPNPSSIPGLTVNLAWRRCPLSN